MRRFPIAVALAACLTGPAAADEAIRIKGSDTIGGKAMPEIAEAYHKRRTDARLTIEALGSSTAFIGLFDGSADIGESSRPINEKETAAARELGLKLQEHVIGYDGVAVIVNPANVTKELTTAQVSALFTGRVRNWKEVGGKDARVRIITRPTYSGTYAFFKEKALRRGDPKGPEEFAATAEVLEENGEILRAVASDPNAVSYVGLGWVTSSVRALPVVARPGEAAIPASAETVRTGRYPFYRPLLIYVPSGSKPAVQEYVRFVLSREGAAVMARNGFIPVDAPPAYEPAAASVPQPRPPLPAVAATSVASPGSPARPPDAIRILFRFGSVALSADAEREVDAVAKKLRDEPWIAVVSGHADAKGRSEANRSVALARANAVAYRLLQAGIPGNRVRVEGDAAEAPVATNATAAGRAQNRRVDIRFAAR
jgi:phosphate transport system substrate-binding protein